MNTLLIVVGVIFLICVLVGYKRGLLKIAVSLVSTLFCIALVMLISPSVSKWIQEKTPLRDTMKEKCVEWLMPEKEAETDILQAELSRENQISLIEGTKLPEIFRKMLLENNNSEVYTALGVQTFGEYVGVYIAKVVADIVAFLVAFVAVFIIVRILLGMLKIFDKIPLVGTVNHLAGGAVGVGIALLIVWVLFIVITLLYSTSLGKACFEDISKSQILTKLYDGNFLMNYITKF